MEKGPVLRAKPLKLGPSAPSKGHYAIKFINLPATLTACGRRIEGDSQAIISANERIGLFPIVGLFRSLIRGERVVRRHDDWFPNF